MNKRNGLAVVLVMVALFGLFFYASIEVYAEENAIYGHISYVDGQAYVLKPQENRTLKAAVNLPLVPGDIIYTDEGGRCELQFDNGTVIRLDKNTELRLDTVLSESLTGKHRVTTLNLKKGHIYSKNQVYKLEIFQVVTPTASVKMMKRSTNAIMLNDKGETHVYVGRGKVGVLWGKDQGSLKTEYVGAKKGLWVTKDNKVKPDHAKKNGEFFAWNDNINANFKELHYGQSKVPEVVYRRSPGIVHFAEKWSTRFGEWVYNDLFGYVWKPYADTFDGRRPFWDANYVEINGELVLVPNQPWGWAPAHLGTWFWSKTYGWTWIPGDAFCRGICAIGLLPMWDDIIDYPFSGDIRGYAFGTLGHWIYDRFGSFKLYRTCRNHGSKAWRDAYKERYGAYPPTKKPSLKGAPENIKDLIKIMDKAPMAKISRHLAGVVPKSPIKLDKNKVIDSVKFDRERSSFARELALKLGKLDAKGGKGKASIGKDRIDVLTSHKRDWNPDSRWARKVGAKILYSSKENAVVCPKYRLSSNKISDLQRTMLRRSVVNRNYLHSSAFNGGYAGGSAFYSSTTSPSGGGSAGASSGGRSGGGTTGESKK